MADDEHPLAHIAEVERNLTPEEIGAENDAVAKRREPDAAPDENVADRLPARLRLRQFEDHHLGKDTPRIGGRIEKGHGSIFNRHRSVGGKLSDEGRAEHAALERLVEAEEELQKATAALAAAEARHAEAANQVEKKAEAHAAAHASHAATTDDDDAELE